MFIVVSNVCVFAVMTGNLKPFRIMWPIVSLNACVWHNLTFLIS